MTGVQTCALPIFLDYGKAAYRPLAKLATRTGVVGDDGSGDRKIALKFIDKIRALNRSLGIDPKFKDLRPEDMDEIARRAVKEAVPLYPTPVTYTEEDVKRVLALAMGE